MSSEIAYSCGVILVDQHHYLFLFWDDKSWLPNLSASDTQHTFIDCDFRPFSQPDSSHTIRFVFKTARNASERNPRLYTSWYVLHTIAKLANC